MLLKSDQIKHVLTVLDTLNCLRDNVVEIELNYLNRLSQFGWENRTVASIKNNKINDKFGKFKSVLKMPMTFIKKYDLISGLINQTKKLKENHADEIIILVIASNRLTLNNVDNLSPREFFAYLAKGLPGQDSNEISLKISNSKKIYIFDPMLTSRFWKRRHECWNDNIYIFDGAWAFIYIIFYLKGKIKKSLRYYNEIKAINAQSGRHIKSLFKVLFSLWFVQSVHDIFEKKENIQSIYFTSNSLAAELLRVALIELNNCSLIIELLHGAGSIPAENYYQKMLASGAEFQSYKKLFFIPLVPTLPFDGVFKTQLYKQGLAINSYLNQYIFAKLQSNDSLEKFIELEWKKISAQSFKKNRPLVLTLFGNCPINGELLNSVSFNIECTLIEAVIKTVEMLSLKLQIVYVPHPAIAANVLLDDIPFFVENNVTICLDSTLCWLISDLCIALTSSTLFESVYFGVHAFTPMLESDKFYSQEYLSRLSYPKTSSFDDCIESLNDFIFTNKDTIEPNLIELAKKRRLLMVGNSENIN